MVNILQWTLYTSLDAVEVQERVQKIVADVAKEFAPPPPLAESTDQLSQTRDSELEQRSMSELRRVLAKGAPEPNGHIEEVDEDISIPETQSKLFYIMFLVVTIFFSSNSFEENLYKSVRSFFGGTIVGGAAFPGGWIVAGA